ncbi:hypothetical protein [Limnoglobus roseus]|uniref:Uncharacterized protein n=1 Tax=Limnoglobus roseus TaxID=2598579 RepID=A0A5C1AM85_9BACT|nr:hypothetical protein [Limnoglobus roseus]QEL18842.1 hypothetical protein PX52LOC_05883 [Limnoglobus roseus]
MIPDSLRAHVRTGNYVPIVAGTVVVIPVPNKPADPRMLLRLAPSHGRHEAR